MAEEKKCPECGAMNSPDSILCANCLADLEVPEGGQLCPTCGEKNLAGSRECATCGQPFGKGAPPAKPPEQMTRPDIQSKLEAGIMADLASARKEARPEPEQLDLPDIGEAEDLLAGDGIPADLLDTGAGEAEPSTEEIPSIDDAGAMQGIDEGQGELHDVTEGGSAVKDQWLDQELGLDEYVGEESLCPQCGSAVSIYEDNCRNCGAQFVTDECRCDNCGELVKSETIICPNCKTFMVEEETKCPVCNSLVSASEPACPICGAEFAPDEYRCAQCASVVDVMEIVCPSCGTFLKEGVKIKEEVISRGVGGAQNVMTSEVTMSPDQITIAPGETRVSVEKVVVQAEIAAPQRAPPASLPAPDASMQKTQRDVYPFTAVVGQDSMKLALILNAIDINIGGVLLEGQKGTAKSIAVRGLAELLPTFKRVQGCRFNCDPESPEKFCWECRARFKETPPDQVPWEDVAVRVTDLPLNATEDRVVGTINVERILTHGLKAFEHGLLAEANRGLLYIDEINLLDDFIVDVLLDSAAMGVCSVEREGISVSYPAKFIIIGSMNPEEGALRPQLLDRIGTVVKIRGIENVEQRMEIVRRREDFDKDPDVFRRKFARQQEDLRKKVADAKRKLESVKITNEQINLISKICLEFGVDGHRADITIQRASRANAAYNGRLVVTTEDISIAAELALPHRMRRRPFEEEEFTKERLDRVIEDIRGRG